jgi:hypothetical protein
METAAFTISIAAIVIAILALLLGWLNNAQQKKGSTLETRVRDLEQTAVRRNAKGQFQRRSTDIPASNPPINE